ncbi:MAG: DUF4474 domain-containing protein [Bacillota bacterium]
MCNMTAGTGSKALDGILAGLGYAYDADQVIFYSTLEAWQRSFGYCRLYDEAAPLLSMIIDCEPVHFEYRGRQWLIQFWKGQYALTTGCEIGVYLSGGPGIALPGVCNGPFYNAAGEITINGTQASLLFAEPRTPQPATRTPSTDWLIQRKNEMLCKLYRDITGQSGTMPARFAELQKRAPGLYNQAINIGRTALLLESRAVLQNTGLH